MPFISPQHRYTDSSDSSNSKPPVNLVPLGSAGCFSLQLHPFLNYLIFQKILLTLFIIHLTKLKHIFKKKAANSPLPPLLRPEKPREALALADPNFQGEEVTIQKTYGRPQGCLVE
uniref:Uncharacterized protein n=1 Tax=Meloidogyne hapla TaxID=6305 RepID=A0A1I8BNH4_MELHA